MNETPTIEEFQKRIIERLHADEAALVEHQVALCPLIGGAVKAVEERDFEQVKHYADLLKEWLTESYKKRACLTDTIQMLYYFAEVGSSLEAAPANDAR